MTIIGSLTNMGQSEFLAGPWPNQLYVTHGDLDRFRWLQASPELESIDTYAKFVERVDAAALVYLGSHRDESNVAAFEGCEFGTALEQKPMFSVGPAELYSQPLHQTLMQLRSELGLSRLSAARSIVYGSFGGPAAAWHWDAGANFVVQLSGTKTWHVAANSIIPDPPDRYSTTMAEWPERLVHHVDGPPPRTGPDEWESIELMPGSVMFLPPGYWHSTESTGESLAVNFTFGTPDRSQVLGRYLSRLLRSDARWRRLAKRSQPHSSGDGLQAGNDPDFDALLVELIDHLATIDSGDIFDGLVEFDEHPTIAE